jgi:Flp pilus assembly protein protease CpaA
VTILNRVLVTAVCLAVIAAAVITLLVATEVSSPGLLGGGFEPELQSVADATGGAAAAIIAVSIVVLLLALALTLVELLPRRRAVSLLIGSTQEGMSTIDRDSVCQLAERTAATFR